ncbi:MAG: hypothetical protein HY656_05900, partial [Acidobacteria bacterium]|nr:hypothetical protein [Acidobacteriota bacterium]
MREARILVPVVGGCALAAVAGAGIVLWGQAINYGVSWVLALGVIVAGLLPLLREWRQGTFDLFNLKNAFLAYYVMQFGVWGLWILMTGDTKFLGRLDRWREPLEWALLYALLGVLVFHLGYGCRLGERLAAHLPHFPAAWVRIRVWLLALVLLPVGLWSFHAILLGAGSLADFVAELTANRVHGIREKGYYLLFAWFGPTIVMLATYATWVETRAKKYAVLFGILLLLVLGIGVSLGYRAFVIFPLLQLLCLHHYLRARVRLRPRYLGAGLVVAVLLNIYSFYREVPLERLQAREVVAHLQQAEFWRESSVLFLRRFSGIESLALIVERTESHAYGVPAALTLLTFPIPRAVWAEKITPIGVLYARLYLYDVANPEGASPTLLGELYWNFHVAGILAGMFLVGLFCRTAYSYRQLRPDKSALLLYAVALTYAIWMIDAPTTHTAGFISMTVLVVLALAGLTLFA